MKKIIYIIFFILMINTVFAAPALYFKKDSIVDLKVPCNNNGKLCGASATCQATISYPRGVLLHDQTNMTNQDSYHNITLTDSSVLGEYAVAIYCVAGPEYGYSEFSFLINNTGSEVQNMLPMLIFYIILIAFVLFLLIAAITSESPMLLPLSLLLTMIFSWTFFYIYMHTVSLNKIYYSLYWFFNIATVGIFFIILWVAFMWAISSFSQKNRNKQDLGDNF